jgi:hypothetical protein
MNDDAFQTRAYIYNYFRFLLDTDIPAEWHLRFYDRKGRFIKKIKGDLNDHDTEVVELSSISGLDSHGIMRVYLIPKSRDVFIPDLHVTMFFTEYYSQKGTSVIGHNLHIPLATHGRGLHQRVSPGLVIPEGFDAYLFIAGGCNFHRFGHPTCANAVVTFVNDQGVSRHIETPNMRPLECHKLDFFAMNPGLREHIGTRPFILKITGQGFLAKPFFLFTNGTVALGEHT